MLKRHSKKSSEVNKAKHSIHIHVHSLVLRHMNAVFHVRVAPDTQAITDLFS